MKIWWHISSPYFSDYFIRNPIWSSLIRFDSFLIQSDQKINKIENLMIYFNDYFIRNPIWSSLIHFDPFWTDLIQSDQKINKVENLMIYLNDYFIRNQIWSSLIHFDPFWTDSDSIWSKKIGNWKSDDIFQWLFHQKLKMWKKWKIWGKKITKGRKAF